MSGLERCDLSQAEETLGRDPFALPQRIRTELRDCRCRAESTRKRQDVTYLWLHVSQQGIMQPKEGPTSEALSLDEWLNVVDEAASLGCNWIVMTLGVELSRFPDAAAICGWAQETHGICVGLHPEQTEYVLNDLPALKELDPKRTQILGRKEDIGRIEAATAPLGVSVLPADPQQYGGKPECEGPSKMIFVNSSGELYTCGLVEGNKDYSYGHVNDRPLSHLLKDPALPRTVAEDIHRVSRGCDGCPSLLASVLGKSSCLGPKD